MNNRDITNEEASKKAGIQLPIIHLNGTGAQNLAEDYTEAWIALNNAIEVLHLRTNPNGRDYYLIGDNAFTKARAEHALRLQKLHEVKAQLQAIASHAADFIK